MKKIIVVLGIVIALGCSGPSNKDVPLDKQTMMTNIESRDYVLNAKDLYNIFKENEIAADTKYKNKHVLVYGKITTIGKDIMGDGFIILDGPFLNGVQCFFSKEWFPILGDLKEGYRVAIKGVVMGKMGNVLIKKCIIANFEGHNLLPN